MRATNSGMIRNLTSMFAAGFVFLLASFPACAQTTATFGENQIGKNCGNLASYIDFDTITQCNTSNTSGGLYQKAPLFVGAVTSPPYAATTCDAGKNGMIQYSGSVMQYCNGSSWTTLAAGSLGSSASVTNPSRSGDITTGLFSSTASTVSIATSGVERMRVNGSGYVGIGTTSPAQPLHVYYNTNGVNGVLVQTGSSATARVDIQNSAGHYALTVGDTAVNTNDFAIYDAAVGAARLYVNSSGNVGIGTTSPTFPLYVNGLAKANGWAVNSTVGDTNDGTPQYGLGVSSSLGFVQLQGWSGLVFGTGSTRRMIINGSGNVGIGTTSPGVLLDVNGIIRSLSNIYALGSVGVGTYSPGYKLDVAGDIRATGRILANANGTSYLCGGDDACLYDVNIPNTVGIYGNDTSQGSVRLGSNGGTVSGSGGNVGINTTSPGYTLHVNGNLGVAGNTIYNSAGFYIAMQTDGNLCWYHSGTGFSTWCSGLSDERYKKNIEPLQDSLQKTLQLRGVSFEYRQDKVKGYGPGRYIGMIAQEVEKVFPELVVTDPQNTMKRLDYDKLTAILVEDVKTLKAENDKLRADFEAYKKEAATNSCGGGSYVRARSSVAH